MSEDKVPLQITKNSNASRAAMPEADAFGFKHSKPPAAGSDEGKSLWAIIIFSMILLRRLSSAMGMVETTAKS